MTKIIKSFAALFITLFIVNSFLGIPTLGLNNYIFLTLFMLVNLIFILKIKFNPHTAIELSSSIKSNILDFIICFILFIISLILLDNNFKIISQILMKVIIAYVLLKNVLFPSIGNSIFKSYFKQFDFIRFFENLFLVIPLYCYVIIQFEPFNDFYDILFQFGCYIFLFNFIDIINFFISKSRLKLIRKAIFYIAKYKKQ